MISDATIRWGIEHCFDRDAFATAKPHFWATTYNRTVEEIVAIMEDVKASRSTRVPPNSTDDDVGGGGK